MTPGTDDWRECERRIRRMVRGEFELDPNLIHLNAMLIASTPKRVREAIQRHRDAFDRDPAGHFFERIDGKGPTLAARETERVAKSAASYLGLRERMAKHNLTGTSLIAQTGSTTMGLALLANGVKAKPGQEVVISMHDFFSWREAWQLRCDRSTLRYREIRLYQDPAGQDLEAEIFQNIERQIREQTRVLALTWVHSSTGVKLPIHRIGTLVEDVNRRRAPGDRIVFCVDGVHGVGVENTSFEELRCDFLATGCHKWLFGPRGTGILCALPETWTQLLPTIPTFQSKGTPGTFHTPGGIRSYEHAWAVAEAFEFHLAMGKGEVERHTHGLATRLKHGLAAMPNVHLVTPIPEQLSAGIVCCDVGLDPHEAEKHLRSHGIVAMTSSPDADGKTYLRFSPSILNDESQIERTLKIVEHISQP
jgi:isopenicillin-N epimerase